MANLSSVGGSLEGNFETMNNRISNQDNKAIKDAFELVKNGKFREAIDFLNLHMDKTVDNPLTYYVVALAYIGTDNGLFARTFFAEARNQAKDDNELKTIFSNMHENIVKQNNVISSNEALNTAFQAKVYSPPK